MVFLFLPDNLAECRRGPRIDEFQVRDLFVLMAEDDALNCDCGGGDGVAPKQARQ